MIRSFCRTAEFILKHPLGRRRPFRCILRYFNWQIRSRLFQGPFVVRWINDAVLVLERGMTGATGNLYCGLHEFADMALLLHYFGSPHKGDGFLDCGANVGSFTILASKVCGVPVVACEPTPSTNRRLRKNIDENGVNELVECHAIALGSRTGNIRFSTDRDSMNAVVSDGYSGSSELVPVRSLDDVLAERTSCPSFWKIDVEGYEDHVLQGARLSLTNDAVQIVLLEGDSPSIQARMVEAGFFPASYDPWKRNLRTVLEDSKRNNNLWVRNPRAVEERCQTSRFYSVDGVRF